MPARGASLDPTPGCPGNGATPHQAEGPFDLWHADASGAYDNHGFRLRGHQFADAGGRYRFQTIFPGLYPGRTRHLHVKLRAAGARRELVTQLYFPEEPGNARDTLFRSELLLRVDHTTAVARFDFVLEV
ncbi:MAG TPA: hypothetical protein VEH51_11905 [Burkholderiales bacterium]|nr:hypothetical protein [Burkholderiales bacterium]